LSRVSSWRERGKEIMSGHAEGGGDAASVSESECEGSGAAAMAEAGTADAAALERRGIALALAPAPAAAPPAIASSALSAPKLKRTKAAAPALPPPLETAMRDTGRENADPGTRSTAPPPLLPLPAPLLLVVGRDFGGAGAGSGAVAP
jgi:hypothetical protein